MKKYLILATIYAFAISIFFNVFHYIRNGPLTFRTPEYIYYYGLGKGIFEPYGANILGIVRLSQKGDPTQYFLKLFNMLYPSYHSVQIAAIFCLVLTGIIAFFLGREVFKEHDYRDQMSVFFSACLVSLYPLLSLSVAAFTHDTFQTVFVLTVLYLGTKAINSHKRILLIPTAIVFIVGAHINMSIFLSVPPLALYALKDRVSYKILLPAITIFAVGSSLLLSSRLYFVSLIDVVPVQYQQLIVLIGLPLIFTAIGFVYTLKDKETFFAGTFIYLSIITCVMVRNIRWLPIAMAFLITYALRNQIVHVTEEEVKKKVKEIKKPNIVPYVVILFILAQTTLCYENYDIFVENITTGVHESEIKYTEEAFDSDILKNAKKVIVERNREALVGLYTNAELISDTNIWTMTEFEAFVYCLQNDIDAIFFYPKNMFFTTEAQIWLLLSEKDKRAIVENVRAVQQNPTTEKLFIYKLYSGEWMRYFDDVINTKIHIEEGETVCRFRVVSPKKGLMGDEE